MKLSNLGIGTMRINKLDEMYPAQDMLMQSGQLVQYGTGIMGYGTVPLLVKRNIEEVIRQCLNDAGLAEVQLPTIQPREIWDKSQRWDKYIEEGVMLVVESDKGTFCLAPTAEEAVLEFAREKLKSYKHMPVTFYQIGEKYRNEIRNRGYLLRGKSFLMMDAYSFDTNPEGLEKSYKNVRDAYLKIAEKLEIEMLPVVADNGAMGGKRSEEMMLVSPIGEDTILYDEKNKIALNTEILEKENYEEYLQEEYGISSIEGFKECKAIELGHIFQLGTRYSDTMNAKFIDKDGIEKPYYMGCYGIGVSRLTAAIYELSVIKGKEGKIEGISLPYNIAPFKLQIIAKMDDEEKVKEANDLYTKLEQQGIQTIIDDRENVNFGARIRDAKVLGTPYIAIFGGKVEGGTVELENTKTGEKEVIKTEELIEKITKK